MMGCRTNSVVSLLVAAVLVLAGVAKAQDEVVVRTAGPIDSKLISRHNLTLLASDGKYNIHKLRVAPGHSGAAVAAALASEGQVLNAEVNARTSLPAPVQLDQSTVSVLNQSTVSVLNQSTVSVLNALRNMAPASFYGSTVTAGYLSQPAMKLVENDPAHRLSTGIGVIIADIDNGVDPNHPALRGALMPGFNFITNSSDVSIFAGLDQSTVSVLNEAVTLDQSTVSVLNQSTVSVLNQSTVSVLNSLPPAFGHGTEVAGILRLVAPQSQIMPLKAFGSDGNGQIWDVIRAIYYAVDQGAKVINMSFSCDCDSKGLAGAIDYAANHGVILVAAVGNDNASVPLFPAAYPEVIGIAATNLDDTRASFSNYGNTVDVAAPGAGIITAFPGRRYAAVWGTSFSAPQVAGEAALLLQQGLGASTGDTRDEGESQQGLRASPIAKAISKSAVNIAFRNPGTHINGRIDLFLALSAH